MVLRLLLVRHGLSTFNKENRIQGRDDLSSLSEEGHNQALLLGLSLKDVPINAIYCSPLRRAANTCSSLIKARGRKVPQTVFDEDLLEVDLEPWSGLSIDELFRQHPKNYSTWKLSPLDLELQRKDGSCYKPLRELMSQAQNFICKLLKSHALHKDNTILIVAHNAILRCLILKLIGEPDKGFRRLKINNTSISILNLKAYNDQYQVQIECFNSTTHLQPLPKKGKGARIILVRHGETDWNKAGRFQGQIDIPLNDAGRKQAEATREFLKKTQIDCSWSSTLSRPKETASIILQAHDSISINTLNGLVEIAHGEWEGKLESEIINTWPDLLELWKSSPESVQMPSGETIHDVWSRSIKSWREITSKLKPEETALVVAHDAVNKTIICDLLGLPTADIWKVKQGNGGVSVIDIPTNKDHPSVVTCINLTSHLGSIIDKTVAGAL